MTLIVNNIIFENTLSGNSANITNLSANTITSGGTNLSTLFSPISQSATTQYGSFGVTVDGSGGVVTTGNKGYVTIPYSGTIYGWDIIGNVSGSCIIDVYKSTLELFPPTSANTITGNQKPTLTNQIINRNDSLTGWTTTISTNDIISFTILSATTLTRITLIIKTIKN